MQQINGKTIRLITTTPDVTVQARPVPNASGFALVLALIALVGALLLFMFPENNAGADIYQLREALATAQFERDYYRDGDARTSHLLRQCYDNGGAPATLPYDNGGLPIPTTSPWDGGGVTAAVTVIPMKVQP